MTPFKVSIIAGARPNFVKIAPIVHSLEHLGKLDNQPVKIRLIHTGQHYDHGMSQSFFDDLGIRAPDANLGCGSGTQAEVTGAIMAAFELELVDHPADLVIVVGDVNSTLACSIVAKKSGCQVAHVEAGIRSGDMSMPEEINRIVTDSLSDIFYTPSETANENLRRAGVPEEKIVFVGNVMIDSLVRNLERLQKPAVWNEAALQKGQYLVLTMHRPATVDDPTRLQGLLDLICRNSDLPIIFPVHPRTRDKLGDAAKRHDNLVLVPPMGYLEFIYLVRDSVGVVSDSGGISEETTHLDVPCITLRDNTERPETVKQGTNRLVGHDHVAIRTALADLTGGRWEKGSVPEKWDGKTAERIAAHLRSLVLGR